MKIFLMMFFLSTAANAQVIQGTLILKGSIKTNVYIDNVKTSCKVKIEKVKNLMLEDSYGNPAYNVETEISLRGRDRKRKIEIKHDRKLMLNNLFQEGNRSIVKDLQYASTDQSVKMDIDEEGRLRNVQLPYEGRTVTCSF